MRCGPCVLQHVAPEGDRLEDLRPRARTNRLLLRGLHRWRYVTIQPAAGEPLRFPPRDDAIVGLTARAEQAGSIWSQLGPATENTWRERFGAGSVDRLVRALSALAARIPEEPPSYLPCVYPTQGGRAERPAADAPSHVVRPPRGEGFAALLSAVLWSFTLDFESEARIGLPIGASTLRVLDRGGVRVRDLPELTGVSKEADAMCTGWLQGHGCVEAVRDPAASRGKMLRLTAKGERAQHKHGRVLAETESTWTESFGSDAVGDLRAALEPLVGDGLLSSSPLGAGVQPPPGTWRARARRPPVTLPHYPMVLHRGAFPDGS
jgi:DNA-binding MarR family transcriptional regulator